jgi:hypothetical protein
LNPLDAHLKQDCEDVFRFCWSKNWGDVFPPFFEVQKIKNGNGLKKGLHWLMLDAVSNK